MIFIIMWIRQCVNAYVVKIKKKINMHTVPKKYLFLSSSNSEANASELLEDEE